jgi:hypothetical protein
MNNIDWPAVIVIPLVIPLVIAFAVWLWDNIEGITNQILP